MKKLLYILLGASFLLPGLASCTKEPVTGGKVSDGRLRLSVEVSGLSGGTATRSVPSVDDEDTIGSLYLLFFDKTGDRSGQYIDYIDVEIPDGMASMNVDTDIDFSDTPSLDPSNAYNILAIANIGDNYYINGNVGSWMSQWSGKSESQVMSLAQSVLPSSIESAGLPMHGRMEKSAGENQLHLLLSRDVSRFDVAVENGVRVMYDLVSVSIWNAYTVTSIWEQGVIDYSDPGTRTRYHYRVRNEDNTVGEEPDLMLGDIKGGLYAFENRVASPRANDNLTTCLIIGLKDRLGGSTSFYRINVVGNTGTQQLRRNNVYNLTITAVDGPGANTEEMAYLGESNRLRYTIGQWTLDDNGLIVQDEYSILSIPTKTVTFGQKGQTVELSIHTFSTLPSPAPLTVRSQTYRPVSDNIQAAIDNNTLIITARELPLSETERNGLIVLSYAGLEISLNVVQSAVHDDYLHVSPPDGGISRFPAYAGISSGLVTVQATGPWTAKIYLDGFSFNPSTVLDPVKMIRSTDALVVDSPDDATTKKFRIYTHSFNLGEKARESFVVVELDKDPETYSAVLRLSQTNVKSINVQLPDNGGQPDGVNRPAAAATFNGAGTGLVAGIAGNSDKFFVVPGRNDDNEILPWDAVLVMNGSSDDTEHFEFTETEPNTSDLDQNYVTVRAKGMNISGRDYTATLRVQTDPGTFADIILTQRSATFDLVPAVLVGTIPATGGFSEWITVETDAGDWTTGNFSVNSSIASDGRRLVKHTPSLEVTADNGLSVSAFEEGMSYPASTRFRVKYPKIYYPNRGIEIVTTVTIKVGGMEKTVIAQQSGLKSRPVSAYNYRIGNNWGGIIADDTYAFGYRDALATIPGYTATPANGAENYTGPIPAGITCLHATINGNNTAYNWSKITDWKRDNDGLLVLSVQNTNGRATVNAPASILKNDPNLANNYPDAVFGGDGARINATDTKVYRFLMDKSPGTPITAADITAEFFMDGTATGFPEANLPASAVPLLIVTRGTAASIGNATLLIDVEKGFMYLGESQVFYYSTDFYQSGNRGTFLYNLMYFISNAARYGSHFTDMLIEDGRPNAQPAPWDDHWDDRANDGTDNRGVPSK